MDAQHWDDRYRSSDQLFSGDPNGVLIAEVTDLTPGQALDVGCGEGADALWLARRGWRVTAIDISQVALERAAAAGVDVADRVAWIRSDLTAMSPPANAFDLVSVHYFPLPQQPDHTALRGLLDTVAPGGTLLFASHDLTELPAHHDIKSGDYYQPGDVAKLLDDKWTVLVNETRPRSTPPPEGTHHAHDTVLKAQRLT